MEFKQLLNQQESVIDEVSKILHGEHLLTDEDMKKLNDLRHKAISIGNQMRACPFFHPEALHIRYLQ